MRCEELQVQLRKRQACLPCSEQMHERQKSAVSITAVCCIMPAEWGTSHKKRDAVQSQGLM